MTVKPIHQKYVYIILSIYQDYGYVKTEILFCVCLGREGGAQGMIQMTVGIKCL